MIIVPLLVQKKINKQKEHLMRFFAPLVETRCSTSGREQDAFNCSYVLSGIVYPYWGNIAPYNQYWTNMNHMAYDKYPEGSCTGAIMGYIVSQRYENWVSDQNL